MPASTHAPATPTQTHPAPQRRLGWGRVRPSRPLRSNPFAGRSGHRRLPQRRHDRGGDPFPPRPGRTGDRHRGGVWRRPGGGASARTARRSLAGGYRRRDRRTGRLPSDGGESVLGARTDAGQNPRPDGGNTATNWRVGRWRSRCSPRRSRSTTKDRQMCRAIGRHGAALIADGAGRADTL